MYFLNVNGAVVGPMTTGQVMSYGVDANTPVSADGECWQPLYTFPELMTALNAGAGNVMNDSDIQSKRTLFGILALLIGSLGIQYFTIGKTGGGLITILLSLITCGFWSVLTFVQGILVLCMSNAEFKRKFLDSTSTLPLF